MHSAPPEPDTRCAIFLDFDGTLVDIAPSPDAVVVEPGLTDTLAQLARRLGGAVALISGRPIAQIDHWLSPLVLPAAGGHGAERRRTDGVIEHRALPDLAEVRMAAQHLAAAHPGLLVECKTSSIALHYRAAPQHEALCRSTMHEVAARHPELHVMQGKMVVEVLPRGISKGHAVAEFLRESPFAGRRPMFIGDDVTDEAGFEVVQRAGGVAVRVGDGPTLAAHRLPSAAKVRRWLKHALAALSDQHTH